MRTTLTLEPDVAHQLQERAKLGNKSFKQLVNDALRKGLSMGGEKEADRFTVKPHHGGFRPGVDVMKLNQLNDELETEAFAVESKSDASAEP